MILSHKAKPPSVLNYTLDIARDRREAHYHSTPDDDEIGDGMERKRTFKGSLGGVLTYSLNGA
jgi:hypothetical protein